MYKKNNNKALAEIQKQMRLYKPRFFFQLTFVLFFFLRPLIAITHRFDAPSLPPKKLVLLRMIYSFTFDISYAQRPSLTSLSKKTFPPLALASSVRDVLLRVACKG